MLHGDIKVNDNVIGTWKAVNIGDAVEEGYTQYHVVINYRNMQGYPTVADFYMDHRRGDGPLILTAKLLGEAGRHLKLRYEALDKDEYGRDAIEVIGRFL